MRLSLSPCTQLSCPVTTDYKISNLLPKGSNKLHQALLPLHQAASPKTTTLNTYIVTMTMLLYNLVVDTL